MPLFLELNFSGIGNTIIFQLENLNLATAEILFALFCARFYQLSGAQLLHKCAESGVDDWSRLKSKPFDDDGDDDNAADDADYDGDDRL